MHAQDQYRELRSQPFHIAENIQTAASRHRDIQYYEIPRLALDLSQNLLRVFRFVTDHSIKIAHQYLF